jgi:hypothetical protein
MAYGLPPERHTASVKRYIRASGEEIRIARHLLKAGAPCTTVHRHLGYAHEMLGMAEAHRNSIDEQPAVTPWDDKIRAVEAAITKWRDKARLRCGG